MSDADKEKLDNFQSNERNYGTVSSVDVGGGTVLQLYPVTGDINQAQLIDRGSGNSQIRLTLDNAMDNTNYDVQVSVESNSANYRIDNAIGSVLFRKISNTQVDVTINEFVSEAQNITLHISVKQR